MNTTVIVFIVLALLIAIAVVSVFALGGGEAGVRSAKDAVRELAERNGWTYVPGSIVGEHLYRIEGPGFTVRARNTRGSGPAREVGLNTAFVAERPVDGTLWIGTVDEVDAIDDLVGEPLELEPTSTGDTAFDGRFQVRVRGLDTAVISPAAREALLAIPASRKPQVLLHAPGVHVILHGTVADQADLDAMIRVGQTFLP